ncbi:MAG: GNAT family N-acetyltransferase [Desulfovibrio sp.]|nr:GNAT family N-acetyltransferase [Desulfovibrio sp.]
MPAGIFFSPLRDALKSTEEERCFESALIRAAQASELSDPLSSEPDWILAFHETYNPSRPVLALFDSANAIFLCEEILQDGQTVLVSPECSWLYARPLLGPDPIPLFLSLLDHMDERYSRTRFPLILFGGMSPHTAFASEALLHLGHAFRFYLHQEGVQCGASLKGGLDGFLGRRSGNFRSKLRKAWRKAHEASVTYSRFIPEPDQVEDLFSRMLAVEEKSWKGKIESGIKNPHSTLFYKALMTRLAREGRARLMFAEHEGVDIGFIFGGVSNGIYRGQQFSFDASWEAYSIGNTLQYEQIRWLCQEGVLRYDMGPITGPRMEYKMHWTEERFPIQCWLAKRS